MSVTRTSNRSLSPLRQARLELVADALARYGSLRLDEAEIREWGFNGVSRSQLEAAIDDLVAAGGATLDTRSGAVVVWPVQDKE